MYCSTPGLPVHHQLLDLAQTHVCQVGDAIQPAHPLLLLPSIFPSIRAFSIELALCIRWPQYWSFSFSSGPSNDILAFHLSIICLSKENCSKFKNIKPLGFPNKGKKKQRNPRSAKFHTLLWSDKNLPPDSTDTTRTANSAIRPLSLFCLSFSLLFSSNSISLLPAD